MRAGREAEAGEFLNWRPAWSTGIQSEFQDIQGYAENLLFQETKERERKKYDYWVWEWAPGISLQSSIIFVIFHTVYLRDSSLENSQSPNITELRLPHLNSLDSLLDVSSVWQAIENIDTLTNLESLFLGKNKITKLQNLDALTNLTVLSMQVLGLTSSQLLILTGPDPPHPTCFYSLSMSVTNTVTQSVDGGNIRIHRLYMHLYSKLKFCSSYIIYFYF